MGAIAALSKTARTLKQNSVLFVVAFVFALVSLVPTGVTAVAPGVVGALVSTGSSLLLFLLTPFFLGGMLAMADEALDGRTSLGTLFAGGKDNYFRLLAAMVLFGVLSTGVSFVVLVGSAVVAAVGGATVGGATAGAGGLVLTAAFVLLVLAGFVLPLFLFQFYAAAVVVSDLGVAESFKRSAVLVWRNVVSTLGYSLLTLAVGLLSGVVVALVTLLSQPEVYGSGTVTASQVPTDLVLPAMAVAAVLTAVVSAFGVTYQVSFYADCLERTSLDEDRPSPDASVGTR